ncbi:hypothetical protein HED54_22885 [Ochrobactrum anthropi ATCC 49188]|nr:hypothetical protein [Brucella anthropi ATCC 49188]
MTNGPAASFCSGPGGAGRIVGDSQRDGRRQSGCNGHGRRFLPERLEQIARTHSFALIDIRADWCAVCHRIEREILAHPAVLQHLEAVPLVKVDVTAMDEETASSSPTFERAARRHSSSWMQPPDRNTTAPVRSDRSAGAISCGGCGRSPDSPESG